MNKLLLIGLTVMLATSGAAQAQGYGPRPAYAEGGYGDGCERAVTLAGAHAGVTVLGLSVGGSGELHAGIPGGCRGGYGGGRFGGYASPPTVVYGAPSFTRDYGPGGGDAYAPGYGYGAPGYGYAAEGYAGARGRRGPCPGC